MKIAFILQDGVLNKNTWSGTPYFAYMAIKEQMPELQLFAPLNISKRNKIKRKIVKIINKLSFHIIKKNRIYSDYPDFILKEFSKQVDKYINKNNIHLVISTSIFPFVYTKSKFKMIQITDATPILLINDYHSKAVSSNIIKKKEKNSIKVIQKTDLIVTASDWCRNSVINDYNIEQEKVLTIPFGANFTDKEIFYKEKTIKKNSEIKFLFVGKDWYRKGLDIAVNILDQLIESEYKITLTVIGVKVPEKLMRDYITNRIFLDKNNMKDRKELIEFYSKSHFYIMPSRAEAYGVVFAEAAGFGLPVIATNLGGIPTIVKNNETGILLENLASTNEVVYSITELIEYPYKYEIMSNNARKRYENILNWDSFSKKLLNEIKTKMI